MRWSAILAICVLVTGCGVAPQPESIETVAAFEIPLPSEQDRTEFLSVLGKVAEAEGLHVDSSSPEWLAVIEMTIHASVWRGSEDDGLEASIMDGQDHLGQVWIMFLKGEDPELAGRFRERAMREIHSRWPDTLSLPIMPTGAIPLHRDLIRTPTGYIVDPSAAPGYQLEDPEKRRP